jgi:hypothetical protein
MRQDSVINLKDVLDTQSKSRRGQPRHSRLVSSLASPAPMIGPDCLVMSRKSLIRRTQSPSAVLAMISFITSSVPAPMRIRRESRK